MTRVVSEAEYPIDEGTVHLAEYVPAGGVFLCPRASKELLDPAVPGIAEVPAYNDLMIRNRLACSWCLHAKPLRVV